VQTEGYGAVRVKVCEECGCEGLNEGCAHFLVTPVLPFRQLTKSSFRAAPVSVRNQLRRTRKNHTCHLSLPSSSYQPH